MTDTQPEGASAPAVDENAIDEIADVSVPDDQTPAPQLTEIQLSGILRKMARSAKRAGARGEPAFAILCDFQTALVDQEYDLSQDTGYIMGGFESRNHFRDVMTEHAFYQARKNYMKATKPYTATLKNIDGHPAGYIKEAYKWLKMADLSLFEDETFKHMGVSRREFFETYTRMQIDCARQKIFLAEHLMDSGEDDEKGYALMDQVVTDHLPRIGTDDIEVHIAARLESSAEQIDMLAAYFTQKRFKQIMADIQAPSAEIEEKSKSVVVLDAFKKARDEKKTQIKDHPYPYGGFDWHKKIVSAMGLIRNNNNLEEDTQTYAGTQFTKDQFAVEFKKSVEALLRNNMDAALNPDATVKEVAELLEVFQDMRELFPKDAQQPDDVDPAYAHEDYWCWPLMREYGLRSFTHLLDNCQIVMAKATVKSTIATTGVPMTAVADNLLDAESCLQEARYPTDHPRALADIDIDHALMSLVMVQTAPFVANRDWSKSFHGGFLPDDHLAMLGRADRASEKLEGMLEEKLLKFTSRQLLSQMRSVNLRRIEYMLADDCLTLPGKGSKHAALKEAFKALDDHKYDLSDPAIHECMGMTAERAADFIRLHERVKLLERWEIAEDDEADPFDRLNNLKALRAVAEHLSPEDRAFFEDNAEDPFNRIPIMLREVAIDLYNEMLDTAQRNQDDPLKVHECLQTAAGCLKAIHPQILKNDLMFNRVVPNASRQEFLNNMDMAATAVKKLTTLPATGKNWQPAAAMVMRSAMRPELKGADAFETMERLAHKLHAQGQSILDPQLLQMVGIDQIGLEAYMNMQALSAAQDCADEARANSTMPLNIGTMQGYGFTEWRRTLHWISLTSTPALFDEPWQAIGFANRQDFVDMFRESVMKLGRDLEKAIDNGTAIGKGPYQFLQLLKETMDTYDMLGHGSTGNDRESMRRAVRDMGNAAVAEILKDKPPTPDADDLNVSEKAKARRETRIWRGQASRKYKLLSSLILFVNRVDNTNVMEGDEDTEFAAKYRKREYAQRMNDKFYSLTYQRIQHAMGLYDRCKHQPGRGADLAVSVGTLRARVAKNESHAKEIDALMDEFGFRDYDSFAYQAGMIRMKQLLRRIAATGKYGKSSVKNPQAHIAMLRDLDRAEALVDNDLITARDRLDIMTGMGLPPTYLTTVRKMASQYALPLMARAAQDPTLNNLTRWELMKDCDMLADFVGTDMRESLGVDWNKLADLRIKTGYRIAALPLLVDSVRNDWGSLGDQTVNTNRMLTYIGTTLADRTALAAMGLKEQEVDALVKLAPLIPGYLSLKTLREVIRQDLPANDLHTAVSHFWDSCNKMEVDPYDPDSMYGMGFTSPDDYMETVDSNVLRVLLGITQGAENALKRSDAAQTKQQFDAALALMNKSGIEKRYETQTFNEIGAYTRAQIEAAYRAVVPPADAPKPPTI